MLGILAFVGSAQQIGMGDAHPPMDKCFEEFSNKVIKHNYPRNLDLAGASFAGNNTSFPIHMILYDLYPEKETKEFVLYMQMGQCDDTGETILQIDNLHSDSLTIIPESLIKYMGCSGSQWGCSDPFKFTAQVHIFGDGQGIDYQKALIERAKILNACPQLCVFPPFGPEDPRACGVKSCYGYYNNEVDLNDPCLCSRDLVKTYPNKTSHFAWTMAAVVASVLGIGTVCYLGIKQKCNRRTGQGLDVGLAGAAELTAEI